jgi:hypothetical protein
LEVIIRTSRRKETEEISGVSPPDQVPARVRESTSATTGSATRESTRLSDRRYSYVVERQDEEFHGAMRGNPKHVTTPSRILIRRHVAINRNLHPSTDRSFLDQRHGRSNRTHQRSIGTFIHQRNHHRPRSRPPDTVGPSSYERTAARTPHASSVPPPSQMLQEVGYQRTDGTSEKNQGGTASAITASPSLNVPRKG